MARPVRQTGINGARLRFLRQREQWSQSDLGTKLGVHRATLARWETGEADPPYEIAEQLAEMFGVPPGFLFQVAPVSDHEGENSGDVILDPFLRRVPLAKLQKYTAPGLAVLGFSLRQLTHRLPKLAAERIQELVNGRKPTASEIQYLRDNLGPEFNPTSSYKKRLLAAPGNAETTDLALHSRISRLEESLQTVSEFQAIILQRVGEIHQMISEQRNSA
jgi:transcriptional regulator with XRE-family HTH domain